VVSGPERPSPPRGAGEAGVALLMTLVTILLLGVALSLIGGSLAHRLQLTRHEAENVILTALDDAALAEGLAALAASGSTSGVPEHDYGQGKIECRIEPMAGGLYRVVATATYAGRRRGAEAWVARSPGEVRVQRWRRQPEQALPARP
jgi:hypothetical protein